MVLRIRKIVFVGSLAFVLAAVLLLAGPLTGAASASACKRFGGDMPGELSHRHARMAVRCLLTTGAASVLLLAAAAALETFVTL